MEVVSSVENMTACVKLFRKYWKYTGCFVFSSLITGYFIINLSSAVNSRGSDGLSDLVQNDVSSNVHTLASRDQHKEGAFLLDNNEIPRDMRSKPSGEVKPEVNHKEVRHIGFLKVHKAASSTMQNMFFRFGLKRNLTFVFTNHPNYFSRERGKHNPVVKPSRRNGFDILCNHGVFNYDIYSSLLPNDTVYIGIVRDPLAVFISAVNYYTQKSQMIPYLGKVPGNKLQNLIRKPEVYDKGFFTYTKNVMARDFGFLPQITGVQTKLNELGRQFKLVILVEYFEESLILMKRYLNWKLQDILFISNNVYGKGRNMADLTPSDIEMFKKRNNLDYSVYNYFYDRFWKQFEMESEDIHAEVLNFKNVLQLVFTFCKQPEVAGPFSIPKTTWNEEIVVTKDDCKYMTIDELEFIKYLRSIQGSELGRKRPVILSRGGLVKRTN